MHTSKIVIWVIGIIVCIIALLLAFRAGMVVGYRQAEFSSEWQRMHPDASSTPGMNGNRMIWRDASDNNGFLNDHGAIGSIVSITTSTGTTTIVVHDSNDDADKTILVTPSTSILAGPGKATSSPATLRVGENVAVIGTPADNGDITASIIHDVAVPPPQQ